MMFSRPWSPSTSGLSPRAQHAVLQARQEAAQRGHAHIGTEHLLFALLVDPASGAVRLVRACGAEPEAIEGPMNAAVGSPISAGSAHGQPLMKMGHLPFTSRAKKSLELAVSHARSRGVQVVRSEDLLIGLVQEERGVAAQTLAQSGVTVDRAREALSTIGTDSARPTSTFCVVIDDTSDRTIFEQIVHQTQEAVATGTLHPGDRLPPVRQLADTLQIATGTVARAYAELERLGVVITDGARGTSVAPLPAPVPAPDRPAALVGLLRPAVVAAFHLGAQADELRAALATAMHDIFRDR